MVIFYGWHIVGGIGFGGDDVAETPPRHTRNGAVDCGGAAVCGNRGGGGGLF